MRHFQSRNCSIEVHYMRLWRSPKARSKISVLENTIDSRMRINTTTYSDVRGRVAREVTFILSLDTHQIEKSGFGTSSHTA